MSSGTQRSETHSHSDALDVRAPRAPASVANGSRGLRMKTPTEAVSVLVVEDEWPARNFLVTLLQESGLAEVTAAVATLDEAREALGPDGIAVDVAFVDVQLAGAARDDAGLALIRSLAGAPEAPLFVLATASDAHAVEAFDLGVVDYLL